MKLWPQRAVWLAFAAAAALIYLFENGTGTRILLLAVLLAPVLSGLTHALPRPAPEASLSLPQRMQRGETAAGQLRLCSNARLPMRLAATLTLRNRLTGESHTIPLQARLRARGQLQLPLEVSSAHCGAVEVTVSQLRLLDAFGLFSRRLSCRTEALVRVLPGCFPLTVSLAENAESAADGARYSTKTPGSDPGETFRIREYVPGDPIRQIHWKLSEKTGTLLLREFGLPLADELLVLLETGALPGAALGAAEMDDLLDLLFSLGRALLADGRAHTVGWVGAEGALRLQAVDSEAALQELLAQLLDTPLREDGQTVISRRLADAPAGTWAHTAILSPYLPPDLAALRGYGKTSVLLTRSAPGTLPLWADGAELLPIPPELLQQGKLHLPL